MRRNTLPSSIRTVVLPLALLFCSLSSVANAQIDNLLSRVPSSANALVIIDAAEAQKSAIAKAQGWEAKLEAANVSRATMLPPEADKIVVAAMLDPTSYFQPDWELGVVHLTETMSMRSIARAESGYVDKINGLDAAWTPSDAYFVSLDPHTLGIMSPANRQAVSRWAEYGVRNQKTGLSGYLQSAAKLVGKQAPIVLAVDLKDCSQPHQLRKSLEESPLLKDKKDDVEKVAGVVSSIQGITLKILLAKTATGELRIDFGQSVAPLAKNAKPLVLEALGKFQAQLDELESWSVSLDGNSILMKGEFSDAGLRRVLSLLELPTTKFSSLKDAPEGPATPDVALKATKVYFSSVSSLVDELEKTLKNSKRDTHLSWMEKYAKKIDRLPILNVDEEAVVFGACVAETFRGAATDSRAGNIRAGVQISQGYANYPAYYNYYGYGVSTAASQEAQAAGLRAGAQGATTIRRFDSMAAVQNEMTTVRRRLTAKYNVEF